MSTTETTFSSFNQDQGKAYAQVRPGYSARLYQDIADIHTATGGQLDTVLDVGCGPGIATRGIAPRFAHAIGLDPSEGMVVTARSLGGTTSTSEAIRFEISSAESLGANLSQSIPDASVDLITAANSAHWFDMTQFWQAAARILKPGGSVALWTSGGSHIHPSVPNSVAIQAVLDNIEETQLKPFLHRGNLLTRGRYVDLPLPWTLEHPVLEFDQKSFIRQEWDANSEYYTDLPAVNLDVFEKMIATTSPVIRWREAHPATIGTDKDIVKIYRNRIEPLLHEAGVEKGKEMVKGSMNGVLLIVKKKKGSAI